MKHSIRQLSIAFALFLINLASHGQGLAQSTPQTVEGSGWTALTSNAPAVASDGTNRYMVWRGQSGSKIYFSIYNGTSWSKQQVVGGSSWTAESSTAPALAYGGFGSTLLLAWKGKGSDKRIWFSTWDGTSWSTQQVVSGTDPDWTAETSTSPALGIYGFTPYLAWKGASGDKIWYSYNLSSWATQQTVSGPGWTAETSAAPALTTDASGDQWLFWKGKSGDDIWWSDGELTTVTDPAWSTQTTLGCSASTNVAPAASFFVSADHVELDQVVFWKSSSGTSILYSYGCGTVSGSGWNAATDYPPAVATYSAGGASAASILAWKNASDNTILFLDPTTLPSMTVFAP